MIFENEQKHTCDGESCFLAARLAAKYKYEQGFRDGYKKGKEEAEEALRKEREK